MREGFRSRWRCISVSPYWGLSHRFPADAFKSPDSPRVRTPGLPLNQAGSCALIALVFWPSDCNHYGPPVRNRLGVLPYVCVFALLLVPLAALRE